MAKTVSKAEMVSGFFKGEKIWTHLNLSGLME